MKKYPVTVLFLFAVFLFSPAVANEDQGLYDPAPPKDAAFVRFLSDQDGGGQKTEINGKSYGSVNEGKISSYYVVPEGAARTRIGDSAKEFAIEAGHFYTLVLKDNNLDLISDPASDNQAKAQIIFYNLSDQDNLSLKTADGKVEIIPPLNTGQASQRLVNPVKVPLAVYEGDRKIRDLGSPALERTQSYSAIALSDNDVEWVTSSTNTTR